MGARRDCRRDTTQQEALDAAAVACRAGEDTVGAELIGEPDELLGLSEKALVQMSKFHPARFLQPI